MESELTPVPKPAPAGDIPINRRAFLNLAWLASLGIVAVATGGTTYFFALPRFGEGEFGGQFSISPANFPAVHDPPAGYPKGRFWLSRTDAGLSAFYMVCTHLGCLYSWIDTEGHFRCPCHGSEFRKDGTWQDGPAPRALDRFVIRVIDPSTGEVVAQTNPETLAPLLVPGNQDLVVSIDTSELLRGPHK
jgi:cytochrome b6-f complex iron-sulfur subunit